MDTDTTLSAPSGTEETTATTPSGTEEGKNTDLAGKDKKLSEEAASWRTKFRDAEKQISTLQAQMEELKSASSPSDKGSQAEVATLRREVEKLQKHLDQQQAETKAQSERARQKTLQAALSQVASDAQLNEVHTALRLMQDYAQVADDDVVVFKVKDESGKEVEVEANAENLRKYNLLPAFYFPAEGVPGTGSKGSKATVTTSVDLVKAANDPAYYKANKAAIDAARRAQMRK